MNAVELKELEAKKEETAWNVGVTRKKDRVRFNLLRGRKGIEIEASIYRSSSVAVTFKVGTRSSENGFQFHLNIFSLWLFISWKGRGPLKGESRSTSLSIHHYALYWEFWYPRNLIYDANHSRWRKGNWQFVDFLLGKTEQTRETLVDRAAVVPLPEGAYKGWVKLELITIRRKRWPFIIKQFKRGDCSVEQGVPAWRKGEYSYTNSIGGPRKDEFETIGTFVADILRRRPEKFKLPRKETSNGGDR